LIDTACQPDGAQEVVAVRGDPDHPANFGRLCTKGSTLHLTAQPLRQMQTRLLQPAMRVARDQQPQAVSWDAALDHVAQRFAQCITEHGPDSVAFYISGQLLTEDYYVFNKLAKGLIGTNNVDTNSRLCMSSAVAGYKQSLGADAPPLSYRDVEQAHTLFITGSNTAWAHPVLYRRIEQAKAERPDMRLIVVDPRRTETAAQADLHLAIVPGTDVALHHAMLHVMLWEGWIDRDFIAQHTEGFDALRSLVKDATPSRAAQICGVSKQAIEQAAQWFATSPGTVSLYCQGLNQSTSGTSNNASLINLHLASGQIGRTGAGPFSLTGQPNAMGGREVGGLSTLLPAHRDLANPGHRAEIAQFWGVDELSATPGLSAVELFDALHEGTVKMVWIACTNPVQSMPNAARVQQALRNAELVVLQEAYASTATAPFADVLLPATTWAEKDGTVTNSERRISRVLPALPAPGQARHDWEIVTAFAKRLQARLQSPAVDLFPYVDAQSIWEEHRETTRGRDLDITGLTYSKLEQDGPQFWPFPEGASHGRERLYENKLFETPSGKARFVAQAYRPAADAVDARFPFVLMTGRLRDQWHGMSRTGTVGQLFEHAPEPVIEMSPSDLTQRRLSEGQWVRVTSRRGSLTVPVRSSDSLRASQVFMAMHWGSEVLAPRGVNALTQPAFCPSSKQPELKISAVRIEGVQFAHHLVAFGLIDAAHHLRVRTSVRALLEPYEAATVVSFGREREGVALRVASSNPFNPSLLRALEALFDLHADALLRYEDPRRHSARWMQVQAGKLRFVLLMGDTAPQAWLRDFLEQGQDVATLGRSLLQPSGKAPEGFTSRGRAICNCFGISEQQIQAVLVNAPATPQERLQMVQKALCCGTSCGSCLPEIRRLIA
jgi:assimilatory nitrate reductase catalytic subunit